MKTKTRMYDELKQKQNVSSLKQFQLSFSELGSVLPRLVPEFFKKLLVVQNSPRPTKIHILAKLNTCCLPNIEANIVR